MFADKMNNWKKHIFRQDTRRYSSKPSNVTLQPTYFLVTIMMFSLCEQCNALFLAILHVYPTKPLRTETLQPTIFVAIIMLNLI